MRVKRPAAGTLAKLRSGNGGPSGAAGIRKVKVCGKFESKVSRLCRAPSVARYWLPKGSVASAKTARLVCRVWLAKSPVNMALLTVVTPSSRVSCA